jgi:biofilm PGA synthesis N-glycosyltransferase PgaC
MPVRFSRWYGRSTGVEMRYAVITPARNEAENLPRLEKTLAAQSVPPEEWVIVDNGSTDETADVARELEARLPWARHLEVPGAATPTRGGPVVRAFQAGIASLTEPVDVVVKVDADVSVDPDYFERLLHEFAADQRLGMASGTGYREDGGTWRRQSVTGDHVWGPARAYRWTCLPAVLPLEEAIGWDGIDEIKARLAGWETRNIPDLPFRHHRLLGLRDGTRRRQWINLGESAHYIGYRPSYVLLRGLFRMRRDRWAPAIVWGYIAAALARKPRCADPRVRAYVRHQQRFRALPRRVAEVFPLSSRSSA